MARELPEQVSSTMHRLQALVNEWREPQLLRVRSFQIIPDCSNRSHSGKCFSNKSYIVLKLNLILARFICRPRSSHCFQHIESWV